MSAIAPGDVAPSLEQAGLGEQQLPIAAGGGNAGVERGLGLGDPAEAGEQGEQRLVRPGRSGAAATSTR